MSLRRIGPYALLDRLGDGPAGELWLAQQEAPIRRRVALKVLPAGLDSRAVLSRFERERRALAALSHPHVAKVLDAGICDDGRPYFVREQVDGEPLVAYCERRGLDVPARIALLFQVCDAVQHAHQKSLVHRDLEPAKILVSESSGRPACKLVDFGLARALAWDREGESLVTQRGAALGTPAYMAPEQAGAGFDVDTRADVYSLGVLLYELLTGRRPRDAALAGARSAHEVERAVLESEPLRPSAHDRRLRGDLDWICLRALEKERERRYGSPAALADDLRRYLDGEPIAARAPTLGYRLAKLAGRHRAATLATCALVVLLVGGAATMTALQAGARRAAARERAIAADLARLADLSLVREAEREADELWPPALLPELEAWIETYARPLESRRPAHRARLAALPAAGADRWERATLAELLIELDTLLEPDPVRGTLGSVRARIDAARRLEELRGTARHVEVWRAARDAIRASPRYGGLDLPPQVGLEPLRADPHSGLWEFWHVSSGAAPELMTDTGSWRITGDTGLVLVLLPGAEFLLGAQGIDPSGPRYDPLQVGVAVEGLDRTTLAPFFVSKYEMTQGQWRRVAGRNPSRHVTGGEAHPVERVSWHDCAACMRRIAFRLPTEAQWEYAARGGADSPWWSGAREEELEGCANVADRSMQAADLLRGYLCTTAFDDGWVTHAPVGSFRPNAFGLFDSAGNVYEWCEDVYGAYGYPRRDGDGRSFHLLRSDEQRIDRGGSFYRPAMQARSAERDYFPARTRLDFLGLRPVRALDPR